MGCHRRDNCCQLCCTAHLGKCLEGRLKLLAGQRLPPGASLKGRHLAVCPGHALQVACHAVGGQRDTETEETVRMKSGPEPTEHCAVQCATGSTLSRLQNSTHKLLPPHLVGNTVDGMVALISHAACSCCTCDDV